MNVLLPFGPSGGASTFPVVHPVVGLQMLDLTQIDMYCSVGGPPTDWASHLADHQELYIGDLSSCTIPTSGFAQLPVTLLKSSNSPLIGTARTRAPAVFGSELDTESTALCLALPTYRSRTPFESVAHAV